jgi:hypothetical protein
VGKNVKVNNAAELSKTATIDVLGMTALFWKLMAIPFSGIGFGDYWKLKNGSAFLACVRNTDVLES